MSSDTTTIILIDLAGLCLIALAVVLAILIGWRRKNRRQARLERGFKRARKVEQSGSGIQGTPYSVYGKSAWSNNNAERR